MDQFPVDCIVPNEVLRDPRRFFFPCQSDVTFIPNDPSTFPQQTSGIGNAHSYARQDLGSTGACPQKQWGITYQQQTANDLAWSVASGGQQGFMADLFSQPTSYAMPALEKKARRES